MDSPKTNKELNRLRSQLLSFPRTTTLWEELDEYSIAEESPTAFKIGSLTEQQHRPTRNHQASIQKASSIADHEKISSLVEQCLNHFRCNNFDSAEECHEDLNRLASDNPWSLALKGLLYTHRKNYKEAMTALESAADIEPTNPWFRLWICENALLWRDYTAIIKYGTSIETIEGNKRMAYIGTIALALKLITNREIPFPDGLAKIYTDILLDLGAEANLASARSAYKYVIRGIEARLHVIVASSKVNISILNDLYNLNSQAVILLHD